MRQIALHAGEALLNLLYPPSCLGCGAYLSDSTPPLCHRCLHRLEQPDADALHARLHRLTDPKALDAAFALWLFDEGGTVQRIQHLLKYGNRPRYGVALGRIMGKAYANSLPDLVLPIPLHRARLYERGYNQSAMLGRGMAERLGVRVATDVLVRTRATRSQTRLSREARWQNVSGAFAVTKAEAVADKHILLIDDVLTTGATLAAAAATLKSAGAASVTAATLALARQ
jgi:ComF family protein